MSEESLAACQQQGTVESLMTPKPLTIEPDATLGHALALMEERRIRHLPVVDGNGRVCGLLSQRDLARAGATRESPTPAREAMAEDVETVEPDCCGGEAARRMLRAKLGALPVVHEDGHLVGILTEADFLRLAAREWTECGCRE